MSRLILIPLIVLIVVSCISRNEKVINGEQTNGKLTLSSTLHPDLNSKYIYKLFTTVSTEIEANSRKIESGRNLDVELRYLINKDSLGNLVFKTQFDKMQVTIKDQNGETTLNAADGLGSFDPMERALGILKASTIIYHLDPKSKSVECINCDEISHKLLQITPKVDDGSQQQLQKNITEVIKQGMLKKNVEQLFDLLPDSVIKPGDSWVSKMSSSDQLGIELLTKYTLKGIRDGRALISAKGTTPATDTELNAAGFSTVAHLSGEFTGEYEIEIATGMMVAMDAKAKVEGSMIVAGNEFPILIKYNSKITGSRSN